jgi:hypothetical protein
MDAGFELVRQHVVNHSVTFEPALSPEGRRYDMYSEVRLSARLRARMPGVQMRLVDDFKRDGREGLPELLGDGGADGRHAPELRAFFRRRHRSMQGARCLAAASPDIARSVLSRLAGPRTPSA